MNTAGASSTSRRFPVGIVAAKLGDPFASAGTQIRRVYQGDAWPVIANLVEGAVHIDRVDSRLALHEDRRASPFRSFNREQGIRARSALRAEPGFGGPKNPPRHRKPKLQVFNQTLGGDSFHYLPRSAL